MICEKFRVEKSHKEEEAYQGLERKIWRKEDQDVIHSMIHSILERGCEELLKSTLKLISFTPWFISI